MTALIRGLTSAASQRFNGLLGRISSRQMQDGRWELLVEGPDGVGTVNLRPPYLDAPVDCVAILRTARRLPKVVQVANAGTAAPPPGPSSSIASVVAPGLLTPARPRARSYEPCKE